MADFVTPDVIEVPKEARTLALSRMSDGRVAWGFLEARSDDPNSDLNKKIYVAVERKGVEPVSPAQFLVNPLSIYYVEDGKTKKTKFKALKCINGRDVLYKPGQKILVVDDVTILLPPKRNEHGMPDLFGVYPDDIHITIASFRSLGNITVSGLDVASANGRTLANRVTIEECSADSITLLVGHLSKVEGVDSARHTFGITPPGTLKFDAKSQKVSRDPLTLTMLGNCSLSNCRFETPLPASQPPGAPKPAADRKCNGFALNVGGINEATVPVVVFSDQCEAFTIKGVGCAKREVRDGEDVFVDRSDKVVFSGRDSLDQNRQTLFDAQKRMLCDFASTRIIDKDNPNADIIVLDTGKPLQFLNLIKGQKDKKLQEKSQTLKLERLKGGKEFQLAPGQGPIPAPKAEPKTEPIPPEPAILSGRVCRHQRNSEGSFLNVPVRAMNLMALALYLAPAFTGHERGTFPLDTCFDLVFPLVALLLIQGI